ncbi:MAG: hypothetical protein EKK63_04980 [Acinetobacter sp.]|uniref:hypothetical protein n=1 Tax=Acinetobacter sp. TaxID=472 RepID=UPI000FA7BD54|nr:hypothetical protein [Acinetobacter sp.]RUP41611.1 MAG: hypothetical protein EKK63_04980 [Acinetobacter sp.]
MSLIKIDLLRAHNTSVANGSRTGTLKQDEVRAGVEGHLEQFAKQLNLARAGGLDERGRNVSPINLSLAQGLQTYFGMVAPERDEYGRKMNYFAQQKWIIRNFLRQMDVYMGSDTLSTVVKRFGGSHLSSSELFKAMIDHSQFAGLATTGDFKPGSEWRFIIPELIMAAIRTDYEASSMHNNWIALTQNITQDEITMPQIKRGNAVPKRIGEGESIQFGSVAFGKKKAGVYKVGIGFNLTDELIERSSLDMLYIFLGEVGNDMSICADYEAYSILRNGEQEDGSESSPVIGVDAVGTLSYKDLKRGTSRMNRLGRKVSRIITGEDDGIDLTMLPEFTGFNGGVGNKMGTINSILGVPDTLQHDTYSVADDETILVDPTKAMAKLQYGSMKVEERRNPQNQTQELFVSDYVGFAVLRKDARLVIDKSVTIGAQGFPDYMDVDARIAQAFGTETA